MDCINTGILGESARSRYRGGMVWWQWKIQWPQEVISSTESVWSNIFESMSGICYSSFLTLILNPAFGQKVTKWLSDCSLFKFNWRSSCLMLLVRASYHRCHPNTRYRPSKCSASTFQFDKLSAAETLRDFGRLDHTESEARTGSGPGRGFSARVGPRKLLNAPHHPMGLLCHSQNHCSLQIPQHPVKSDERPSNRDPGSRSDCVSSH